MNETKKLRVESAKEEFDNLLDTIKTKQAELSAVLIQNVALFDKVCSYITPEEDTKRKCIGEEECMAINVIRKYVDCNPGDFNEFQKAFTDSMHKYMNDMSIMCNGYVTINNILVKVIEKKQKQLNK